MTTKLWAANEAKHMNLKDERRNMRVMQLLEALAENPAASISQACDGSPAKTKAAYRFIGQTAITEQDILQGHYHATVQRAVESKEKVLVLSDGMDASFSNLTHTKGLGPITSPSNTLGIKLHNTFAVGSSGISFGLINYVQKNQPAQRNQIIGLNL